MTKNPRRNLHDILREPGVLLELDASGWNRIIRQAQNSGLLGRLALNAEDIWDEIPEKARYLLLSGKYISENNRTKMGWEINRITRALHGYEGQVVLLKGGAYIAGDLTAARGRFCTDIDILVSRKKIDEVEQVFFSAGWQSELENEYDQRYYRELMHELPPLRHEERGAVIDIHHAILPPTGRLHPDTQKLLAAAVPAGGLYVLSPADMLLHSAAHLYYDGDMAGGLRNVLEQHDMLTEFGKQDGFWDNLVARAVELELVRPLYYALRYASRLLGTRIPDQVWTDIAPHAPSSAVRILMDFCVLRVVVPRSRSFSAVFAAKCLYIRSHWLRMPPLMLARHLMVKFARSFKRAPKSVPAPAENPGNDQ